MLNMNGNELNSMEIQPNYPSIVPEEDYLLKNIRDFFGLGKFSTDHFPSRQRRTTSTLLELDSFKERLVYFCTQVFIRVCSAILPHDGDALLKEVAQHITHGMNDPVETFIKLINALPPKSIESRVLVAAVSRSIPYEVFKAKRPTLNKEEYMVAHEYYDDLLSGQAFQKEEKAALVEDATKFIRELYQKREDCEAETVIPSEDIVRRHLKVTKRRFRPLQEQTDSEIVPSNKEIVKEKPTAPAQPEIPVVTQTTAPVVAQPTVPVMNQRVVPLAAQPAVLVSPEDIPESEIQALNNAFPPQKGMAAEFRNLLLKILQEQNYEVTPVEGLGIFKFQTKHLRNAPNYPEESQVKSFITQVHSKRRRSLCAEEVEDVPTGRQGKRSKHLPIQRGIESPFRERLLKILHDSKFDIAPLHALAKLKYEALAKHDLHSPNFPTDIQVKRFVSQTKNKYFRNKN